jgi:Ca2+-binding EF-hand superfamily protein
MDVLDDLERIHLAVAEMSDTGSSYTGTPTKSYVDDDHGGRPIHNLDDLQLELTQRCTNPEDWAVRVSQLYDDLTSQQQTLSKEQLTTQLLSLCPLTPNQARSVTQLLSDSSPTRRTPSGSSSSSPLFLSPDATASLNVSNSHGASNSSGHRHYQHQQQHHQQQHHQQQHHQQQHHQQQRRSRRRGRINKDFSSSSSSSMRPTRQPRRLLLNNPSTSESSETKTTSISSMSPATSPITTFSATDPTLTMNNLRHLRTHTHNKTNGGPPGWNLFFQSVLPDSDDMYAALHLMRSILKQKARRAITNYDLFSSYFDTKRNQKSTFIDFKHGLTKLGINIFGTHDSPRTLFKCFDISNNGYFTSKDMVNAIILYHEGVNNNNKNSVHTKIQQRLQEDELRKNYERIAKTSTESSLRWQSSQLFHRTFDHSTKSDGDKDNDPRKLLNGMCKSLAKKSLRDWDIFMICDDNRNGSITPMEFANGLSKLHLNYTPRQLQKLWTSIDLDNSGTIEFDELRLALSMAKSMGENTLPGSNNNSNSNNKNNVVVNIPKYGNMKEEKAESSSATKQCVAEEDERTKILKHRADIVRKRIGRNRLKILLSKLKSAISSWYNHDRHTFLLRHGTKKTTKNMTYESKQLEQLKQFNESWNDSDTTKKNTGSADDEDDQCHLTIGRAKQQLRTMVPFTTKEMNAYISLLNIHYSLDDEITLKQFDDLLNMIEYEMKILLGPHSENQDNILLSPTSRHQLRNSHRNNMFLMEGSITDIMKPSNTPTKTNVLVTASHKKIEVSFDKLIHKMQHQLQRNELLNESLFSGVNFNDSSSKSLRLQFNLLGFHNLSIYDILALQSVFTNTTKVTASSPGLDSYDLHYILICRKLQNACYSMIDSTIITSLSKHDHDGNGYISIDKFVYEIEQHISLQVTEDAALRNILKRCSHKDIQNTKKNDNAIINTRRNEVCCYLDMFTKSPVTVHGRILPESIIVEVEE